MHTGLLVDAEVGAWLMFIALKSSGGADGRKWDELMDETDVSAMAAEAMELLRCDEKLLLARLNVELGDALMVLSVSFKLMVMDIRSGWPALQLLFGDVDEMRRKLEFDVMLSRLKLKPIGMAAADTSPAARFEYGGPYGTTTGTLVAGNGNARLPVAGTLPMVSGNDSTRFL